MSYSFDKDAKDGDVVTLENGVAYQYDEAKDRWLVKDVAGSGSGADWGFPLPEEQGNYVSKTGGDEMEGPLEVNGGRDPDSDGIVSTLKVLNVDSGENSDLQLRADGSTRIYVGKTQTTLNGNLKFSGDGAKIVSPEDNNIMQINNNGVFYDGNISAERHLVNKEYVDNADQHLETKIDELEQELDVVAPRLESGSYTYANSPSVKAGEMHIGSGTFTAGTDIVFFNDVALDGKTHTWAELNEGDYLEVTDTQETRTAENYAMYLVTKAPEGSGLKQIEVALVKGQGAPTAGDVMDAKGFQLGGNDINDLDDRYAVKGHKHSGGDITSGTISINRLPTGTTSSTVAVGNHTHSGYAAANHTHSGLGGSAVVKHGYSTRIDYDHNHYGNNKVFAKYRSWNNGYTYEVSGSTKISETGEVMFVSNSSGFYTTGVGKSGLLIASTSNANWKYYPYLVMNIWDTETKNEYGYMYMKFRGVSTWCRSSGVTWSSNPELYWIWVGDPK